MSDTHFYIFWGENLQHKLNELPGETYREAAEAAKDQFPDFPRQNEENNIGVDFIVHLLNDNVPYFVLSSTEDQWYWESCNEDGLAALIENDPSLFQHILESKPRG